MDTRIKWLLFFAILTLLLSTSQSWAMNSVWDLKFPFKDSQIWYISEGYDRFPQPRQYEVVFKIYVDPDYGNDVEGTEGRPVLASGSGTVIFADWLSGMGYTVKIYHGDGWETWYSNLQNIRPGLMEGYELLQGTYIASASEGGVWFSVRYNANSVEISGISSSENIVVGQWYRSYQKMPSFDSFNDMTTCELPYDFKMPFESDLLWWILYYGYLPHHEIPGSDPARDFELDLNFGSGTDDCGLRVISPVFGVVTYAQRSQSSYGNTVVINAGNGFTARVAHLQDDFLVNVGDTVRQGSLLGYCGNTGLGYPEPPNGCSNSHIHFEVKQNGVLVDLLGISGNYQLHSNVAYNSYNQEIPLILTYGMILHPDPPYYTGQLLTSELNVRNARGQRYIPSQGTVFDDLTMDALQVRGLGPGGIGDIWDFESVDNLFISGEEPYNEYHYQAEMSNGSLTQGGEYSFRVSYNLSGQWREVPVSLNSGNVNNRIIIDVLNQGGDDPGNPDVVIVGNIDGSAVGAYPGETIDVPVWVKTDDDVEFIHIPIATEDQFIASRIGGEFYSTLTQWDEALFLPAEPNQPANGYTSQSIFAVADLYGDPNPPLNTNGEFQQIAIFRMQVSSDPNNIGQSTQLIEGFNATNEDLLFGLSDGTTEFRPVLNTGTIVIYSAPNYFIPNCEFEENLVCCPGADAVYRIVIRDDTNNPIENISNIWLDCSSALFSYHCPSMGNWPRIYPVAPSNANGELYYYIAAGGVGGGSISVKSPYETLFTIEIITSFDTDSDIDVDEDDWISVAPENDYNADGVITWEDNDIFRAHIGHYCEMHLNLNLVCHLSTDPPSGQIHAGDTVDVYLRITNNSAVACTVNAARFKYHGFNIGGSSWQPFDSLFGLCPFEIGQTDTLQAQFVVPSAGHGCIKSYVYLESYPDVFRKQLNLDSQGSGYHGVGDPPLYGSCEVEIGGDAGFPVIISFFPTMPDDWVYTFNQDEFVADGILEITVGPEIGITSCENLQPGVEGSVTAVGYGPEGEEIGSLTCEYTIPCTGLFPGDANNSCGTNGLDVVFLVNYFKGGPAPSNMWQADVNGDCAVNGLDVIYLVNYLKGDGPAPHFGNECTGLSPCD